MIKITCRECRGKLEAPEEAVGKKGKCFHCGAVFEVPGSVSAADEAPGESVLGEEHELKIIRALESLDVARKFKSAGGGINRDLALKIQSIAQGSKLPGEVIKDLKGIIKEHGCSSDIFADKLKHVISCLNDLKRAGKSDEDVKREWERLARSGWKKKIPGRD